MTSRRSSGSMRAERAVEPTKSENITVTWRRSARSSGGALGVLDAVLRQRKAPYCSRRYAEPRWHPAASAGAQLTVTPSSFRVSCVKLGRTVSSISFSRNAASYFPRPRLRSHTTMSMTAPTIRVACIILWHTVSVQGAVGSGPLEDPPIEDGGSVDEAHYANGVDYLHRVRYGCGAVLRQSSGEARMASRFTALLR